MDRKEAIKLLKKYNKEKFHIYHALCVEEVMRYFAIKRNYDPEFWGVVGLLHDVDFEMYPGEHCKKAPELLKEINTSEEMIRAICSHGYGRCSEIKPEHEMEKILFTIDELTGIIFAAAKMRPSKSTKDMELSSIKKKFKDRKFAAGCSRDVITSGIEMLGWDLDQTLGETLNAMKNAEDKINQQLVDLEK